MSLAKTFIKLTNLTILTKQPSRIILLGLTFNYFKKPSIPAPKRAKSYLTGSVASC